MTIEFSRQIFDKYSNTKFNKNSSGGNLVDPCGRADGRTNRGKDGRIDGYDECNFAILQTCLKHGN